MSDPQTTLQDFTKETAYEMLTKPEIVMTLTNKQLADLHEAFEAEIAIRKIEKAAAEHG